MIWQKAAHLHIIECMIYRILKTILSLLARNDSNSEINQLLFCEYATYGDNTYVICPFWTSLETSTSMIKGTP